MASVTAYKNTGTHRQRYMQTEVVFVNGMKYTDAPHSEGYAKTIVNFSSYVSVMTFPCFVVPSASTIYI